MTSTATAEVGDEVLRDIASCPPMRRQDVADAIDRLDELVRRDDADLSEGMRSIVRRGIGVCRVAAAFDPVAERGRRDARLKLAEQLARGLHSFALMKIGHEPIRASPRAYCDGIARTAVDIYAELSDAPVGTRDSIWWFIWVIVRYS